MTRDELSERLRGLYERRRSRIDLLNWQRYQNPEHRRWCFDLPLSVKRVLTRHDQREPGWLWAYPVRYDPDLLDDEIRLVII